MLLCSLAIARAAGEARPWIARLCDPATQLEAFREYRLRDASDEQKAKWATLDAFAADHPRLRVTAIPQPAPAPPEYLVTFSEIGSLDFDLSPEGGYGQGNFKRLFFNNEQPREVPIESALTYYVFAADGQPIKPSSDSFIFSEMSPTSTATACSTSYIATPRPRSRTSPGSQFPGAAKF